jgi:nucleoside-diphosphate-sugar epimerase
MENEHIDDLIKARAALVERRREAAKGIDRAYVLKNGRQLVDIQGMIEAIDKALEDERAARRSEQFEKGQAELYTNPPDDLGLSKQV